MVTKTLCRAQGDHALAGSFLEDDEFVADEIPNQSRQAASDRADQGPLIGIEPTDFVEGKNERRGCDIYEKSYQADNEELSEFRRCLFLLSATECPVLVPEVAVHVRDDE